MRYILRNTIILLFLYLTMPSCTNPDYKPCENITGYGPRLVLAPVYRVYLLNQECIFSSALAQNDTKICGYLPSGEANQEFTKEYCVSRVESERDSFKLDGDGYG